MSSEVDPVAESDEQEVGDAGPTEKETRIRDWFARREATTWMALLGGVVVIYGGVIVWQEQTAGTLLVVGAVLVALGTLGRQIVNLRGRYKDIEIAAEFTRSEMTDRVEDAESLLDQWRALIMSPGSPGSSPVWAGMQQRLEDLLEQIKVAVDIIDGETRVVEKLKEDHAAIEQLVIDANTKLRAWGVGLFFFGLALQTAANVWPMTRSG